ncbi:Arb2 domain-containing protein [Hypoxylon sp. FL1857]|nr:Arb2 domain-containing protein [Hypoxylon sp. FL1857]
MFRRKWSGLPADPQFPSDLKELGYFVNEDDEIRAIDNPDNYFKFFLSRNPRWNDRQRFAMNQATQNIIWERLENLGLKKELLPLGTTDLSKPHAPIFVSKDIASKTRVVIIFGETVQDLGAVAHRVIGGRGGVNKGSMVSIVSELLKQRSSPSDPSPPGIILANMGELIWWPGGNRTLSRSAFDATPMKSAVQNGNLFTKQNEVPGNETFRRHVNYIFEEVIPHFVNDRAGIDVIGVGDSADTVEQYLDLVPVWETWKKRINCLALVGGLYPIWDLKNEEFGNQFLRKKARAYATSLEPAGMVLSGPDGNPKTTTFTQIGCPVFSSGEPYYTELTLIMGRDIVLDWLQEVAMTPEGQEYANPEFEVVYADPMVETDDQHDWSHWQDDETAGEKDVSEEVKIKNATEETGSSNVGGEEPRLVVVVEAEKAEDDDGKVKGGEKGEK